MVCPILGLWQAVDDHSHQVTAAIRLEWQGEGPGRTLHGRVEKVLNPAPGLPAATCQNCKGALRNQPVEGMEILWALRPDDAALTSFVGGTVLDPTSGKDYRCSVRLRSDGQLEVRGFIGLPVLGRTQLWRRPPSAAEPAPAQLPNFATPPKRG